MIRSEGLNQLQLGIAQIEMRESHGAFHDIFAVKEGKPELVAPELEGLFRVGHGNGEMIETVVREG
jgi:hypothetical protein